MNDFEMINGEKWIWVTGYKGTDRNMKCKNDFQYEIGKLYEMDKDSEIAVCSSGFHMCLHLTDVFIHYGIGDQNRFFEVRALVRENDAMNYVKGPDRYAEPHDALTTNWVIPGIAYGTDVSKLAARSIEFIRELTTDEILEPYPETKEWGKLTKITAIVKAFEEGRKEYRTYKLTTLGYTRPLAEYICSHKDTGGYDLAVALDSQPGLGMDTKIVAIFSHI